MVEVGFQSYDGSMVVSSIRVYYYGDTIVIDSVVGIIGYTVVILGDARLEIIYNGAVVCGVVVTVIIFCRTVFPQS